MMKTQMTGHVRHKENYMTSKYKVGQQVKISHVFVADSCGKFVKCTPFVATVIKAEYTPTNGYAYTLSAGSIDFKVCYWEADIDGPAERSNHDEEIMWKTWGDR